MNKTTKGILVVVGVAAAAFGVWYFLADKKKRYAKMIIKMNGASSYAKLLTFSEEYLKDWARAIHKGQETFESGGKTYNTMGGSTVKA